MAEILFSLFKNIIFLSRCDSEDNYKIYINMRTYYAQKIIAIE